MSTTENQTARVTQVANELDTLVGAKDSLVDKKDKVMSTTENQTTRVTQVANELDTLVGAKDSLVDKVANLTNRLVNVLREPVPTPEAASLSDESDESICPLAHQIRELRRLIEAQISQIADCTNRLEV